MNFKLSILLVCYFHFTSSLTPHYYVNSNQLPLNLAGLGGNGSPFGMSFLAPFPYLHHSLLQQANSPLTLSGGTPYDTIALGPHLMNHPISGSLRSPQAEALVLASMLSPEVGQNSFLQLLHSLSTARSTPVYGLSAHSPLSYPSGFLGLVGQSAQLSPYLMHPSFSSGLSLKEPPQVHHHHLPPPSEPEETSIFFDAPSPNINVVFRSSSKPVNVQQVHTQTPGSLRQTSSVDSPQKLVHTVTKPIIHELNEIIAPVRKVNQEVLPVREEIITKVTKNHLGEMASSFDSSASDPSQSTFPPADSQFSKESSSQQSLPIFSASSDSENSLQLEKETYGERPGNDPPFSDGVVGYDDDALSNETNNRRKMQHGNGGEAWVDEQELVPFLPEDAVNPKFNQQPIVNQNWK